MQTILLRQFLPSFPPSTKAVKEIFPLKISTGLYLNRPSHVRKSIH